MYQNRPTLIGFLGKDAEILTPKNSEEPQGGGRRGDLRGTVKRGERR
jgi:hypothetical protein